MSFFVDLYLSYPDVISFRILLSGIEVGVVIVPRFVYSRDVTLRVERFVLYAGVEGAEGEGCDEKGVYEFHINGFVKGEPRGTVCFCVFF